MGRRCCIRGRRRLGGYYDRCIRGRRGGGGYHDRGVRRRRGLGRRWDVIPGTEQTTLPFTRRSPWRVAMWHLRKMALGGPMVGAGR
jgi:hypothetical protein